ncbi:FAD-dependent monooxygenase [Paenibacillus sp. P96]|uniref:FAD-dependent monooxygenase n=1 Tax=Paenibacillus zeirhizosphaerae TaxID=2987519 RepID=A0ABT9FN04_9BACL|nr:FAD-dependent monooxygenase [Paenibacillus sp. P96]MDP4096112.1 FAD-dependent monooxygenase [Paenibacillus sp. P96]
MHFTLPTIDVLIVGAGPTGLTLACDLARRGISHRIIERSNAFNTASKAKGIQPRSLEVLDDLGAVDSVVRKGIVDLPVRYYSEDGTFVDKPSITVAASAGLATPYPNPIWIAQFDVEGALRERYAQFGGQVELGLTVVDLIQDEEGVTVTAETPEGAQQIRTRYVVGADGGKSTIRKLMNLSLVGETFEQQRWYLGDIRLEGLERDRIHVWVSKEGMFGLTPLPNSELFQLQATIQEEIEDPEQPSLALYQAMLDRRAGAGKVRVTDASWLSIYRVNVRMVEHYRNGRVFLAGDAAHVHSPAGGQGMNTGIQDAYNLGWKLAAVLHGSDAALLDTYDEERRPVARTVLKDSTKKMDAVMETDTDRGALSKSLSTISDDLTSGLLVSYRFSVLTRASARSSESGPQPGDRAPEATGLLEGTFEGSVFDLLRGPHWTLLAFVDGSTSLPDIGNDQLHVHRIVRTQPQDADAIVDCEGNAYRAYAAENNELILIRPDGYVAMRASIEDTESLLDYLLPLLSKV